MSICLYILSVGFTLFIIFNNIMVLINLKDSKSEDCKDAKFMIKVSALMQMINPLLQGSVLTYNCHK